MISPPPATAHLQKITGSPKIGWFQFEEFGIIQFWNQLVIHLQPRALEMWSFPENCGTTPKPMTCLTASASNEIWKIYKDIISWRFWAPPPLTRCQGHDWCWKGDDVDDHVIVCFLPFPVVVVVQFLASDVWWQEARVVKGAKLRVQGRYFVLPCFIMQTVPTCTKKIIYLINIYIYIYAYVYIHRSWYMSIWQGNAAKPWPTI